MVLAAPGPLLTPPPSAGAPRTCSSCCDGAAVGGKRPVPEPPACAVPARRGADDDPFIVLTETKFSFRCIPVWIGTLLTGLGSKKKKTHVIMFSP